MNRISHISFGLSGRLGKSGGYRLVTYYLDRDTPVFLLTVLDKSKKANLSEGEKQATKRAAKSEEKQRRQ